MRKTNGLIVGLFVLLVAVTVSAQPEKFFEAESVGRSMKFLGIQGGSSVFLRLDCSVTPPPVPGECFSTGVGPTPQLDFNFRDLAYVTFPKRTAQSIITLQVNGRWNYFFNNSNDIFGGAIIQYLPYFTIESEVLNDPRAIDNVTGQPMNGSFDTPGIVALSSQIQPFAAGQEVRNAERFSLMDHISKGILQSRGVPQDLAAEFFRQPITIRFNLRGRTRLVQEGEINYGVRFTGD